MTQIQAVQREKKRLEVTTSRLKNELNEASRKISSLECDVADAKCTIKQRERQIEKVVFILVPPKNIFGEILLYIEL